MVEAGSTGAATAAAGGDGSGQTQGGQQPDTGGEPAGDGDELNPRAEGDATPGKRSSRAANAQPPGNGGKKS